MRHRNTRDTDRGALARCGVAALVAVLACACGGKVRSDRSSAGATGGAVSELGGSSGIGGSGAAPCAAGTVTLRLIAPPGAESAYCAPGCGLSHVTITAPTGEALSIGAGCSTSCDDCIPVPCILCPAPPPMTAQGWAYDWDGSYYLTSTCSGPGGDGISCAERRCAAPGRYDVTMCASPNVAPEGSLSCYPIEVAECWTESFDYPGSGAVTVSLGLLE